MGKISSFITTRQLLILLIFSVFMLFAETLSYTNEDIQKAINQTHQQLMKHYWSKDTSYKSKFKQAHSKGLFESNVHFNFVSKHNSRLANWITKADAVEDINMFVTNFILYGMIEANQLGTIQLDNHIISQSLQTISNFRDKNTQYGLPQYVFWSQKYVNGTWSASPQNLVSLINRLPEAPKWTLPILAPFGLALLGYFKQYTTVFVIPADNDDSSVNMALLGFLKETNSPHYSFWNSLNYNKQLYYQQALKYAYRPFTANFSKNINADQIDPRTYYVYWQFIEQKRVQAQKQGKKPELILPTTWLINKKQSVKGILQMPLGSNNVDVSVCANFIFGLAFQVLTGQVQMTQQLTKMVLDTVDLLIYSTQNRIQKRPDITLVYYPSKYDFYWFLARLVNLLKRHPSHPYPFDVVYEKINRLMKTTGTEHLLKNKKSFSASEYYWAEFLGNYGGKTRNHDALFATSLAVNALLDTWTIRKGQKVAYDSDVTETVKQAIKFGINTIMNRKNKLKKYNAFFSGSFKQFTTYSIIYPSNVCLKQDGTPINPQTIKLRQYDFYDTVLVKGVIPKQQYEKFLTLKWFQFPVPQQFVDYNSGKGFTFPYWQSESITDIMIISSLSKYLRLQQN